MDTTTKTPEELTEEWKAGKLVQGWYFCKLKNGLIHHFEFNGNDFTDLTCHIPPVAKILAPCNYDEYKAMQKELAEHRRYCCCSENEVMRLKLAEMEELLKECLHEVKSRLRSMEFTKMTSQSKEPERECIRLENLLTRINAALGESEE